MPGSGNAKRQDNGLGPAFDGSTGVDSQDIANSPNIAYTSFAILPDFTPLTTNGATPATFDELVQSGVDYVQTQASAARAYIFCVPIAW
jgi:mannan endo-1,4-beta-mannosidase